MQADQNIVYSETQKLDVQKWILRPMFIAFGLLVLLITIPMLYFYFTGGGEVMKEIFNAPFIIVTLVGGLIPCIIMYMIRRRMSLELNITKNGMSYKYRLFSVRERSFLWNDVESVEIKKYPFAATRPGEQRAIYLNGQEIYIMTVDLVGAEIKMKDGKFKFFTSNNPEELVKAIKNLELNIRIIK